MPQSIIFWGIVKGVLTWNIGGEYVRNMECISCIFYARYSAWHFVQCEMGVLTFRGAVILSLFFQSCVAVNFQYLLGKNQRINCDLPILIKPSRKSRKLINYVKINGRFKYVAEEIIFSKASRKSFCWSNLVGLTIMKMRSLTRPRAAPAHREVARTKSWPKLKKKISPSKGFIFSKYS